jgi:titin
VVEGNYIGTDVTGTQALGNHDGILVYNNPSVIGGTDAGAGNVISGNRNDGIFLSSPASLVQGNYIGTDFTGANALGNAMDGVFVNSFYNLIGGTVPGAGNTIAFNGRDGVRINSGTGNGIRGNVIMGHDTGLGIELIGRSNNNQAFPVLASAVSDGSSTTITGSLTSAPSTTFIIEFFANTVCNPSGYGEGERFLDSTTVATDANVDASFTFTVAIAVDPGQFIAATATDPANNTSAFSLCVEVTPPASPLFVGDSVRVCRDLDAVRIPRGPERRRRSGGVRTGAKTRLVALATAGPSALDRFFHALGDDVGDGWLDQNQNWRANCCSENFSLGDCFPNAS